MDSTTLNSIIAQAAERVNEYTTKICEVKEGGHTPHSPLGRGLTYAAVVVDSLKTGLTLGMVIGEIIAEMAEEFADTGVTLSDLLADALRCLGYPEIDQFRDDYVIYWLRVPYEA